MSKFKGGDRVSIVCDVVTAEDDGTVLLRVSPLVSTWFDQGDLTLVERPPRELHAGDRIVACDGPRSVWIWSGTIWLEVGGRRSSSRDLYDESPEDWDFYPTPTEPEAS